MRFSALRRTRMGFLEVGVWNRFVGFWVNAVGFSTALLLDFHQSGILQFPQGVDRLLPPAVEQLHYLVDGIVEVNPPIFICPAVFPGQVCPAQDKGVQNLCFVGQWRECGCFKEEIREPGEADRFLRLMNINSVCHTVFCGQLGGHFRGRTVLDTTSPVLPSGSLMNKGFSPPNCPQQTSFSVHFLFSAACELWRRSRDSISPGWTLGRTLCRRPHSVLAPYPGKSLLPASRFAVRPTSGTTYSRPRKKWSGGRCGRPRRQGAYSSRPHSCSTPGGLRRLPVSSVPVSCGREYRPACVPAVASLYRVISHAFPPFFAFAVRPEKASCPISAACSSAGTLPGLRDILSRSWLFAVLPLPGYSFSDGHFLFKVQLIDELP